MKGLYKICDIYFNVKCEIRFLYDFFKNIFDVVIIFGLVVMVKNLFKLFLYFRIFDKKFSFRVV